MANALSEAWPSWQSHFLEDGYEGSSTRGKRARVALACQRCKTRKQKCDGAQPCAKCQTSNQHCEYVVPQKPMPFGKQQYIRALERRVAELETVLASHGMAELSSDHWGAVTGTIDNLATSSTTGSPAGEDEPEAVLDWQDGIDSVAAVLRSLSLDVNGSGYVGASSHIAFGRLFSFIGSKDRPPSGYQRRKQSTDSSHSPHQEEDTIKLAHVPVNVADRLFDGYLKHIATRWPVVHSVWIQEVHQRRLTLTDAFEAAILHLVYATAGRFVETTGELGSFHAKRHFASAAQYLHTVLGFNDMRSVQALMLMAVYCLRDPAGAGAWICNRTALLIAIDHGMHRQTKALSNLSIAGEVHKRLFWACYSFDRQISIPMGRPFGISDRDIDIELPLDINENTTEQELLSFTFAHGSLSKSTSLSSFIHVVQLRQIESDIQQTVYRVDKNNLLNDGVIDDFLAQLELWRARIPQDTQRSKDVGNVPYDGYDYYMAYFYKCQRLLLYPQISKTDVLPQYLKACAKACAGVCGAYKRLHQALAVGYSLMALQTVFMAGLTLVYCLWISPSDMFDVTTSNGIHDCSIVLFVISERVPAAKKYRDAFEIIRQRVIDRISKMEPAERNSRERLPGLPAELMASASNPLQFSAGSEENAHFDVGGGNLEELSYILADMAGEQFSGFDTSPSGWASGHSVNPTDSCNFSLPAEPALQ
ncbi:hypothetical protein P154DRAFT_285956 [Amniculicola lignicola CBS 123094]|uniref:Zn(2)-C6 fungal-type domain-containing protein n=1 Tax=Amniculicola lignicola CBS 123094 TaxID=1392246 RepID=A0A6A5X038_9PLEO|nr:hypothetical protein P154DRAFT_285956 [Amniculicola lignicola CBS 123094]